MDCHLLIKTRHSKSQDISSISSSFCHACVVVDISTIRTTRFCHHTYTGLAPLGGSVAQKPASFASQAFNISSPRAPSSRSVTRRDRPRHRDAAASSARAASARLTKRPRPKMGDGTLGTLRSVAAEIP